MAKDKKYFGTDGIRGAIGFPPVTPDIVLKLGWAAGKVLSQEGHARVLIGKDTRISGYMFESALEAGLVASGVDVMQLGPMPTPGVAYLTRSLRAQAGIVISASHNVYSDNGIKFFNAMGMKLSDEVECNIEAFMERSMHEGDGMRIGRATRINDAAGRYIEFCKSTFPLREDLKGIKILVDCANGAAYQVAPAVFRELGAEVITMGDKPNGLNINADCGSTSPEALQEKILETGAELGIALDGDGDRVILVDHLGNILDGDDILYILANHYQRVQKLQGGVVGTSMSNYGLELAFEAAKIPFERAQVGDRYVMAALQRTNWNLGGETSGHIICLDKTTTGDGIVTALQVLAEVCLTDKPLHELKKGLIKLPQIMINVQCENPIDIKTNPQIQSVLNSVTKALRHCGRVVLRPSGTEPVIRVMVEGQDAQLIQTLAQEVADIVKACTRIPATA